MKFEPSTIITRQDLRYPAGAMVVEGYDDNGALLVYPLGGGFQRSVSAAAQASLRVVPREEIESAPFRKAKFYVEGVEMEFEGFTDDRPWNGWATPRFTRSEAERVIRALGGTTARYVDIRDEFVTRIGDEDEMWPAETIVLADGEQIKVYPVGASSWCWNEVEK
ncbi:MAG: hypothetical protein QOH88_1791 [Verrucomicrobiota bacterium]|jgi:hypothetical protein